MILPIWSNRWGHIDNYSIELTETGWKMSYIDSDADCEPTGSPFLERNAYQDSIHYPDDFGELLAYLWRQAREKGMDENSIQEQLNLPGKWQKAMETNRPKGVWEGIM